MSEPKWLSDAEFRAWIGYRRMRLLLDAQIARDLARDSALSSADYDVLSVLSEEDGRGAEIVLTDKGVRAIVAAAPDHVASVRKHFIDLLSPNELRTLARIANKVLAALPEGGDDLGHPG